MSETQTTNTGPVENAARAAEEAQVLPDPSSEAPRLKPHESPYPIIRWLVDEEFWKNVTVNVYSAAIVAVLTVTIVSTAQLIADGSSENVLIPVAVALCAIAGPPLMVLLVYVIFNDKQAPRSEKITRALVLICVVTISVVGVGAALAFGISNIINQ